MMTRKAADNIPDDIAVAGGGETDEAASGRKKPTPMRVTPARG